MVIDKEFRVGSPVRAKGRVTVIERLPKSENDPFGYKVADSADMVQPIDIKPIKITKNDLSYFGFEYQCGSWVFKANNHEVRIGGDCHCFIDNQDAGDVNRIHELKNLLFDNCGKFVLKRYYLKNEQTEESGPALNASE